VKYCNPICKMKNIIRKFLNIFGIRITKKLKIYSQYQFNVFKSSYKDKVLLSYIVEPFVNGLNYSHTNYLECYTVAEIFHNLGFSIDVVDFALNKRIDYNKYKVIFGMGSVLEKSFYYSEVGKPIKIFYSTGCNLIYSNVNTILRVRDFYNKHKRLLISSSRFISQSQYLQSLLSDGVIVLGNQFVLNTFTDYDPNGKDRYYRLNPFFYDVYDIDLDKKDFSKAKKNFLWFGSGGLIHKGLDILLDIFCQLSDINLHICGNLQKERGFFDYYRLFLTKYTNIIYHGFIKIDSDDFKELMNTCGYVVYPSVSEGGSPSVLNTMANGGLVPIITKASGLNMDSFGWVIERPDVDLFKDIINKAVLLSDKELKEKSIKVKSHVRNTYNYEVYKQNLTFIIQEILKNNLDFNNYK